LRKEILDKKHGESDVREVLFIKGVIRQTEALSAAMNCGVKEENAYFLNLPFYETGKVKKRHVGPEDVKIVLDLVTKI